MSIKLIPLKLARLISPIGLIGPIKRFFRLSEGKLRVSREDNWARKQILEMARLGGRLIL